MKLTPGLKNYLPFFRTTFFQSMQAYLVEKAKVCSSGPWKNIIILWQPFFQTNALLVDLHRGRLT